MVILFPSKLFNSKGTLIAYKTCNICEKKINSLRKDCEHDSFEIYNGEICNKIPHFERFEHVAITRFPRDKACIICAPEGKHYSYKYLESIFENMKKYKEPLPVSCTNY